MEFEKGQFIRERANPNKASQPKQPSVAKEDVVDETDQRNINSDEESDEEGESEQDELTDSESDESN